MSAVPTREVLPPDHPFAGLPRNHFRVIYVDPPWNFITRGIYNSGEGRSPQAHYQTMSRSDVVELPMADLAAKDCWLALWITGPELVLGTHLPVMFSWGFQPSAVGFVWVKTKESMRWNKLVRFNPSFFQMGLGFTTRQNAEYVVLGRRGNPPRLAADIGQIIAEPRREHSRKPDIVRDLLMEFAAGPYLELFARQETPGWTAWGNELGRFAEEETA